MRDVASFGENLRHAREGRNITLQEIAVTTKISTRALQALENEQFDQLPGGIFNRGFVRAYARCVGLNEDKAVAEYLAAAKIAPPELDIATMSTQVEASRVHQTWLPNAATVVGVVAVIVALAVGGLWLNERRKEAREQSARRKAEVQMNAAPVAPAQPINAAGTQNTAPQSAPNSSDLNSTQSANQATSQGATPVVGAFVQPPAAKTISQNPGTSPGTAGKPAAAPKRAAPVEISISATARSWISVRSDGKSVETLTLDPDKPEARSRSYTANEKLMLVVGNPAAVSVTYNGKPTGILGSSGQRATITFTPEGMEKQ